MKEKFDFYNSTTIKSYNLNEKIRYQLKMLDGLDNVTRKHSENVANLTCRMCEVLHKDKGFTIYTTTCAYIHDIGKMFIPPSILQKPTKLTPEEYEVMKTHTTIGYKMCMEDKALQPYFAGPLYHHEALDGSGYPAGLKGNEIPEEGQIIRVADVFDALTAKRQYKTHLGTIETLKILIGDTKPTAKREVKSLFKALGPRAVGKADKRYVKALIKVIIEDYEYEIEARSGYLEFLKSEIKRINGAMNEYDKMQAALTPDKREYYKAGVKAYLHMNEDPEKCEQILKELKKAYKDRQKHLIDLTFELREVKHLPI